MFGYLFIGFINFMLKIKCFLDYTNLFSRNEYKNNDKIMLKCFQELQTTKYFYYGRILKEVKMKKIYYMRCSKYRKFTNPKM